MAQTLTDADIDRLSGPKTLTDADIDAAGSPPVPGTEKLGGAPPAAPKAPLPSGLAGPPLGIMGRALENLPRSVAGVSRFLPGTAGILDAPLTKEQYLNYPTPLSQVENAGKGIYNVARHPLESFANDPIGTTLVAAGGIRSAPALAESAMEHMPAGFSPFPHVGEALKAGAAPVLKGAASTAFWQAVADELPHPYNTIAHVAGVWPAIRGLRAGFKTGMKAAYPSAEDITADTVNAPPPAPPPDPNAEQLDGIAQGFGAKDFASANPRVQATARDLVSKMNEPRTPRPMPPPRMGPLQGPAVSPAKQLGAAPRVFDLPGAADTSGIIKGWQPTILNRESSVNTSEVPVNPLQKGPQLVPPAKEVPNIRAAAEFLGSRMNPPVEGGAPRSFMDAKATGLQNEFHESNRGAVASGIAKYLNNNGITAAQIDALKRADPAEHALFWNNVGRAASENGISKQKNYNPDQITIDRAMSILRTAKLRPQ